MLLILNLEKIKYIRITAKYLQYQKASWMWLKGLGHAVLGNFVLFC